MITLFIQVRKIRRKISLPDRESNPGLPRDRRRSSPLDYRGQTYGQLLLDNFSRFESWRDPEKNSYFLFLSIENVGADQKCGTLHDFACHPCAGAMLIFSVSFQF